MTEADRGRGIAARVHGLRDDVIDRRHGVGCLSHATSLSTPPSTVNQTIVLFRDGTALPWGKLMVLGKSSRGWHVLYRVCTLRGNSCILLTLLTLFCIEPDGMIEDSPRDQTSTSPCTLYLASRKGLLDDHGGNLISDCQSDPDMDMGRTFALRVFPRKSKTLRCFYGVQCAHPSQSPRPLRPQFFLCWTSNQPP